MTNIFQTTQPTPDEPVSAYEILVPGPHIHDESAERAETKTKLKHDQKWNGMFQILLEYKANHGHCNIQRDYRTKSGKHFGEWVTKQRTYKRKGSLDARRITLLEQAGFNWNINDMKWDETCNLLMKYRAKHGDFDVRDHHVEEGKQLGYWVRKQRNLKRLGVLKKSRVVRLEEAGFPWKSNYTLMHGHT